VIALYVKSFTNKSVLIRGETPNTVANLKIIASVDVFRKFSASHFIYFPPSLFIFKSIFTYSYVDLGIALAVSKSNK
jgi:hypothetical protein